MSKASYMYRKNSLLGFILLVLFMLFQFHAHAQSAGEIVPAPPYLDTIPEEAKALLEKNIASNQRQSDRKHIKDKQIKSPKGSGTGPRMSDKNQRDMYTAARIAIEEIFINLRKADTLKLKTYDAWWQTYKNSPDLTKKHKSDRRKYENFKKKYFD